MEAKRSCGNLRLACAVVGRPQREATDLLRELEASMASPECEFKVQLANRFYTGPLRGVWFENGTAYVGAAAAERFAAAGYRVFPL